MKYARNASAVLVVYGGWKLAEITMVYFFDPKADIAVLAQKALFPTLLFAGAAYLNGYFDTKRKQDKSSPALPTQDEKA